MGQISKLEQFVIDKIREKRIQAQLTQAVLSTLMDLSSTFVGNVESGKSRLKYNISHLNKLAIIFECSVKDFFPDKPFPEEKN